MFIGHLEVAAVAELEEGLDRIAAGVAGVGGEKQLETAFADLLAAITELVRASKKAV